jgi:signal transduction histidine kinase
LKHYDSALGYLHKCLQLTQEIGTKRDEIITYKNLSELYEVQHNYVQALHYYKKYSNIEKEIFNTTKSKQIAEMKTRYETEKREKEAEVYHLKNVKLRKEIKDRKKVEKELKKHRNQLEELVEKRTIELRRELTKRQSAEKELLKHQNQLRALNHALSLVEEKQRRKTATYLHDNIGQALSLAIFKIRSLQESGPAKNVKKELTEIKDIVAQTNQRTRSLTFEISPPVLYELGLEPAVEWLAGQFQKQHGITCSFNDDGASKPLTDEARILLFQAVRELLNNVSKHARAQIVKVSTARDGNAIRISVEDDGIGFNPDSLGLKITHNEGFGLFNIKERLRHLGGKLEVNSDKAQGTSIALIAPLKRTPGKTNRKRR